MNATDFGGTFELEIASGVLSKTWDHTFYSQSVVGFGVRLQLSLILLIPLIPNFDTMQHIKMRAYPD